MLEESRSVGHLGRVGDHVLKRRPALVEVAQPLDLVRAVRDQQHRRATVGVPLVDAPAIVSTTIADIAPVVYYANASKLKTK